MVGWVILAVLVIGFLALITSNDWRPFWFMLLWWTQFVIYFAIVYFVCYVVHHFVVKYW